MKHFLPENSITRKNRGTFSLRIVCRRKNIIVKFIYSSLRLEPKINYLQKKTQTSKKS